MNSNNTELSPRLDGSVPSIDMSADHYQAIEQYSPETKVSTSFSDKSSDYKTVEVSTPSKRKQARMRELNKSLEKLSNI